MKINFWKPDKSMSKKANDNTWIMDCSTDQFLEIVFYYLGMFDDAQQLASDNNKTGLLDFLSSSYNDLEKIFNEVKQSGNVSLEQRNSARMTIKETYKMIVSEGIDQVSAAL